MNFNLTVLIEAGILIFAFIILMKFIGSNLIQNLFKPIEPEKIDKNEKQEVYQSNSKLYGYGNANYIKVGGGGGGGDGNVEVIKTYVSSAPPDFNKGHFGNTWINYEEDEIETVYAHGGKGNPRLLAFTRVKENKGG